MKFRISRKFLAYVLVFLVGAGAGVGGTIVKDKIFPPDGEKMAAYEIDEIGPLFELEEFIVNLDGGGMVKTEIIIEGKNAKSLEGITTKEIFLRDRIISVLGSKSFNEVTTQKREELKKELVVELNKVCANQVKDVLFKNFVYSI